MARWDALEGDATVDILGPHVGDLPVALGGQVPVESDIINVASNVSDGGDGDVLGDDGSIVELDNLKVEHSGIVVGLEHGDSLAVRHGQEAAFTTADRIPNVSTGLGGSEEDGSLSVEGGEGEVGGPELPEGLNLGLGPAGVTPAAGLGAAHLGFGLIGTGQGEGSEEEGDSEGEEELEHSFDFFEFRFG